MRTLQVKKSRDLCIWVAHEVHTSGKTCPCKVYPLEPHFYMEKLGYAGVYLFFLSLLQNMDCGYSLEPPGEIFNFLVEKEKSPSIAWACFRNKMFSSDLTIVPYNTLNMHIGSFRYGLGTNQSAVHIFSSCQKCMNYFLEECSLFKMDSCVCSKINSLSQLHLL